MAIETAAIVGAGLIGRSWAITFARAGLNVRLFDPDEAACDRALDFVQSVAPDLAEHDLLMGRSVDDVLNAIRTSRRLDHAIDGDVAWVQECGPERIAIKQDLFRELDRLAPPECILASSSSALLPSAVFESVPGRERCLVAHPINPPYLVPAVEIVPSPWTSENAKSVAADFMMRIGQIPLKMEREIEGFIMNRLQGALLEEAFRLVNAGIATAEDIDSGIAEGLALRWSFIGPFETIDLNAPGGVEDYVDRYEAMYAGLAQSMRDTVAWKGDVLADVLASRRSRTPADQLQERQIWRDRRLMALRQHKRQIDDLVGR